MIYMHALYAQTLFAQCYNMIVKENDFFSAQFPYFTAQGINFDTA